MVMYCDICGAKFDNGENMNECPECLCPFANRDLNSPIKEFKSKIPHGGIIKKISTEQSFMDAMIKLYENDPIEFQLKIQQLKIQLEQQEQLAYNKRISQNVPKCPTCKSTNIKKISGISKAGSIAMWGIFSRKVHKQWHCNNCSSEW